MKVRYITIEREYGSGGTKIAQETAKRCGIACYGSEIMETVAREQNISTEVLEEFEESVTDSLRYSLFVMSQSQTGDPDLLSAEAKLHVAESRVIKRFARNAPAVFVGHCASYALKDMEGVLRVFIHADDEYKHRRIVEDYGIRECDVNATCKKFNKKRANYYGFCTRKKWSDLSNYDIVMDSSRLGIEGCAKALSALYLQ